MRSLTLFSFAAFIVAVAPLSCWQSHPINGQESPLNTIQCPLATFCSKKIIGDMIYRGCDIPMGNMAPDCSRDGHVDKGFGAFTYCCSTDYCNSAMQTSLPSAVIFVMTLLALVMTRH